MAPEFKILDFPIKPTAVREEYADSVNFALKENLWCPFDWPHLLLCTAEIRTLVGPLIRHDITLEEITCTDFNREWHTEL